jgi:hypothetical protein
MTTHTKEEQTYIDDLANALRGIEITDKEMADMRLLYKSTNGIPFEGVDSRNRPQGPTIFSSSRVGSKIKRALGANESHYGMNFVGRGRGSKWYMDEMFRAAIDQMNLFGNDLVVADEVHAWEEGDDDFDEEEEIVNEILNDESLTETVREQLVMARVGQGKFRSRVELASPACRLTGLADSNFLVASHIKPWRVCDNKERLDGNNGLMLSPHVDQLFDEGYISFQDDGQMIVSEHLPPEVLKAWSINVEANAGLLTKERARYMAYHRVEVFLR